MDERAKEHICNIIKHNAELIEDSLVEFIVACYKDYPQSEWQGRYTRDMSEVLIKVLTESVGSAQDIADIITEKEGYFKFANLDKFNKDTANRDSTYKLLADPFLNELRWKYKIDPHLDFSPIGYGVKASAYIGAYNSNGGLKSRLDEGLDGYVGVVVSRSIYPQASESAMQEPHLAYVTENAAKLKKATYVRDWDCRTPMCLTTEHTERNYDDPGLIYVPVRKFYEEVIYSSDWYKTLNFTVLPKEIVQKYGLPILEKF